jgi:TonB family protein
VALTTKKVQGLTIAVSVVVHAALTAGLLRVTYRALSVDSAETPAPALPPSEPAAATIAVDLPSVGEGVMLDQQPGDLLGEPPRVTAGEAVAHLDTGLPGRGGDLSASAPALNLADDNDHQRLSPDLLNRLDRDQLQRLRVARVRASWEDRRSTTHPAELTLVANGPGAVRERRASSALAPSRGALESPRASVSGSALGAPPEIGDGDRQDGSAFRGSLDAAPGRGLFEAPAGRDHRASAPVGSARPAVVLAAVAIPAVERALPKDDVDAEQEVATTVQSLVHASTSGGLRGEGQGGNGGGGPSGAGATSGIGSHTSPLGLGEGDVYDYWTSDPRLLPYFRRMHAKIDPLWADAFPKSALLDLKQGTVILEFTVQADGRASVSWPPLRASGVDEFDRNCAEAIRRAAPFPPIPRQLGVSTLVVRAPFVASNPMVK